MKNYPYITNPFKAYVEETFGYQTPDLTNYLVKQTKHNKGLLKDYKYNPLNIFYENDSYSHVYESLEKNDNYKEGREEILHNIYDNEPLIRLKEIYINNFKGIKHGHIKLNNTDSPEASLLALYGPNGSGKSAIIEALNLFKKLVNGESVSFTDNNEIRHLLYLHRYYENTRKTSRFYVPSKNERLLAKKQLNNELVDNFELALSFTLVYPNGSLEELTYSCSFDYRIKEDEFGCPIDICLFLVGESLELSQDHEPNSKRYISWNNSQLESSDSIAKDYWIKCLDDILKNNNHKNKYDHKKSLLFGNRKRQSLYEEIPIFVDPFEESEVYCRSIMYWLSFLKTNFIVFQEPEKQSICIRNVNYSPDSFPQELLVESTDTFVTDSPYNTLKNDVDRLNNILPKILKDTTVVLNDDETITKVIENKHSRKESKYRSIRIEILHGKDKIPLEQESAGNLRIISFLNNYVRALSNPSYTFIIDEIDAGIYEFLLGELLEFFADYGKGQLIFTSHNLRPLEVLNSKCIYFTSTNPYRRFVQINPRHSYDNVRDSYLEQIFNPHKHGPFFYSGIKRADLLEIMPLLKESYE